MMFLGRAVLATVAPFVSEDESIFLRSLLGRTTTIFHTIGNVSMLCTPNVLQVAGILLRVRTLTWF